MTNNIIDFVCESIGLDRSSLSKRTPARQSKSLNVCVCVCELCQTLSILYYHYAQ